MFFEVKNIFNDFSKKFFRNVVDNFVIIDGYFVF